MPTHAQLRAVIAADPLRMRCLTLVRALALPDCWVAAGFVRSAVWDHLHRRGRSALPADIDVIWFDQARCDAAVDAEIEARLRRADASLEWSVKNQARMHLHNGDRPGARPRVRRVRQRHLPGQMRRPQHYRVRNRHAT
ncbi:nucleotidyltransferase family protein [Methylobacterium organophilum]|nr:nucleotidyltransferase family protein [Methylobacterium organophilum]